MAEANSGRVRKQDRRGAPDGAKNALKHGVYTIRNTGEIPADLSTPATVAREREIVENLATEEGTVREQENVTRIILIMIDFAAAHIKRQVDAGKTVEQIPIFKAMPSLAGCAGRELGRLWEMKRKAGTSRTVGYDELVRRELQRD